MTTAHSSIQIISRNIVIGNHRLTVRNGNQIFLVSDLLDPMNIEKKSFVFNLILTGNMW